MRLAASQKMGYYPAPWEAIDQFTRFIRVDPDKEVSILDPCAGEGLAVGTVAKSCGIPQDRIWGIELDVARVEQCRQNLPNANILGPASAFGIACSANSLSMVWANPPFDTDAGTRLEAQFLDSVTRWLVPRGILAFACPQHVVDGYDFSRTLFSHYERIAVIVWPSEVRRFKEVTVLAVKRVKPTDFNAVVRSQVMVPNSAIVSGLVQPYILPTGHGPKRFERTDLLEWEYRRAMDASPCMEAFQPLSAPPLPSPPMSLGRGHLAILLASGHLDGIVHPPGEPPHVVRGTARKTQYLVSRDVVSSKKSKQTTEVYSEKMSVGVRVLTSDGTIHDFGDALEVEEQEIQEPEVGEEEELEVIGE